MNTDSFNYLLLLIILLIGCSTQNENQRPNFVFILTDDISARDLSVYGNKAIETPNLDRMAKEGLVFENAYLTTSSCSPSRNSIITGRYPHNTGAPEIHVELPKDQHTFVHSLQQAGYHTVLSGKNHMAPPEQLGFDEYSDSFPAGSENWINHLRERPNGKPFFFWFASHDAHRDWQFNDKAPEYDSDEIWVPPYLYDGPRTRKDLAAYYHEVSRSDYYLGMVMDELERQEIADHTYLIYVSDNGRPFPRSKTYLYRGGIRTPLVITGPEIESGRTSSLISSIDLAATFLDLAGIKKPETVQGVSFNPVLRDHNETVRDVAFAERNWHRYSMHERMVRMGDWLYIRNNWPNKRNLSGESDPHQYPSAQELWEVHNQEALTRAQALITRMPQPAEELYNLKDDPYNLNNLVFELENRAVLHQIRLLLTQWTNQTGDNIPDNPTPHKATMEGKLLEWERREMPGTATSAPKLNHPGPINIKKGLR